MKINSTNVLNIPVAQINKKNLEKIFLSKLNNSEKKNFFHIATVNPEFLVLAQKNEKFKKILQNTDINICDGIGISILNKIFYNKKIPRITGVSIAEKLCELCEKNNKKIFFIGGFGVAKTAAEKIQKKFPNLKIVGAIDGDPNILDKKILDANPDVILVCFGAPKQEFWIDKFGKKIPNLKIIGGFGGTLDFWANKISRAPLIFQKLGLEWLFRLFLEPKKRIKRIFNAVFVFSFLFIKNFLKKK